MSAVILVGNFCVSGIVIALSSAIIDDQIKRIKRDENMP
jgi:hypothetical protein